MTPTEQDKELREKLNSLFESVFSQGVRAGKDVATETYEDFNAWLKGDEIDEIMKLITADRKRVALEARIDEQTHTQADIDGNIEFWPDGVTVMSQLERLAELKAQQEEV